MPTIGIEVDRLQWKGKEVVVREVGGSFGPVWSDYYKDAKRLLYLVDATNKASWASSAALFWEVVADEALREVPIAVALSKLGEPMSEVEVEDVDEEVSEFFRFSDYVERGFPIFHISALYQKGIERVLDWAKGDLFA
mmetsp:Transcript_46554/g.120126  ORF Transcript_46554/g.120126 Transcript_46554/m.120126 type:complete len:138 (-) Transcript_46554:165-578(-)